MVIITRNKTETLLSSLEKPVRSVTVNCWATELFRDKRSLPVYLIFLFATFLLSRTKVKGKKWIGFVKLALVGRESDCSEASCSLENNPFSAGRGTHDLVQFASSLPTLGVASTSDIIAADYQAVWTKSGTMAFFQPTIIGMFIFA